MKVSSADNPVRPHIWTNSKRSSALTRRRKNEIFIPGKQQKFFKFAKAGLFYVHFRPLLNTGANIAKTLTT